MPESDHWSIQLVTIFTIERLVLVISDLTCVHTLTLYRAAMAHATATAAAALKQEDETTTATSPLIKTDNSTPLGSATSKAAASPTNGDGMAGDPDPDPDTDGATASALACLTIPPQGGGRTVRKFVPVFSQGHKLDGKCLCCVGPPDTTLEDCVSALRSLDLSVSHQDLKPGSMEKFLRICMQFETMVLSKKKKKLAAKLMPGLAPCDIDLMQQCVLQSHGLSSGLPNAGSSSATHPGQSSTAAGK